MIFRTGQVPCQGLISGCVFAKRPPLPGFALWSPLILRVGEVQDSVSKTDCRRPDRIRAGCSP